MYVLEKILEIIGSDEQVREVREFIKEDIEDGAYIDFEKIIEIPSNITDYGSLNVWCMVNWGTQMNAFAQIERSESTLRFLTRDYSATRLIIKLSEIFPEVIFHFEVFDPQEDCCSGGDVYYKFYYCISNGEYKLYLANFNGEIINYVAEYYEEIDAKINKYRKNYKREYYR